MEAEQGAAKAADTKITQAASTIQSQIDQLLQSHQQLTQSVAQNAEQIQNVAKIAKAPRRRVAIRGSDGLIQETREEPIMETQQ
jgi:prefoldin subunit 5